MSGALHHSKGSLRFAVPGSDAEDSTLDAEKAMPENAYRSAITVTPSAKSFSIVDLVPWKGQHSLLPQLRSNSRELPTIGRKEEVDNMIVQLRCRLQVRIYHLPDCRCPVCACDEETKLVIRA